MKQCGDAVEAKSNDRERQPSERSLKRAGFNAFFAIQENNCPQGQNQAKELSSVQFLVQDQPGERDSNEWINGGKRHHNGGIATLRECSKEKQVSKAAGDPSQR